MHAAKKEIRFEESGLGKHLTKLRASIIEMQLSKSLEDQFTAKQRDSLAQILNDIINILKVFENRNANQDNIV